MNISTSAHSRSATAGNNIRVKSLPVRRRTATFRLLLIMQIQRIWRRMNDCLNDYRGRRAVYRELSMLNDRELQDIGITRDDIEAVARGDINVIANLRLISALTTPATRRPAKQRALPEPRN